jgi:hypothetical protein
MARKTVKVTYNNAQFIDQTVDHHSHDQQAERRFR